MVLFPRGLPQQEKKTNGKTLVQHIQGRRMSRAKLLHQPGLTIEQVEHTCASRFSALFKRANGMLPSEFRRTLGP